MVMRNRNSEEDKRVADAVAGGPSGGDSASGYREKPNPDANAYRGQVGYEVADALVNQASFQQAVDLADTYQNSVINKISKQGLERELELTESQIQATNNLQQALDDQTKYYAQPGIVRLFGQIFDGTLSDEYHSARVSNAATKVASIEQQKQINKDYTLARAKDAIGYNVAAEPMIDKARAIMKSATEQKLAKDNLALDRERLAIGREKNRLKAQELAQKRSSPESLKKQVELANYQVQALTDEAKAAEFLKNRKAIESINLGALKTPDVDLGFQLLESSANQPTLYKNAMLSKGLETLTNGVKRQVDMLPNQIDKDMVTTRIENQGVLRQEDVSMASNYYYANIGQRSATASIEGNILEQSKMPVTNLVKDYYDSLSSSDKNMIASESGVSGDLTATQMLALLGSSMNKTDSAVKKLIPYNDLLAKALNEPRKVVDSAGNEVVLPSPKREYANSLALDYGKFYFNKIAESLGNSPVAADIRTIGNSNNSNNAKLSQAINSLIANGADYNSVSSLVSGYADQATVSFWASNYKSNAASYDNQAMAMMPLLGFDGIVVDLTNKLRDGKSQSFYDRLLAEARASINARQTELNNLVKAQQNGTRK